MRVLVVVHGFPPQSESGSEVYAFEHANALVGAGHDVLVLTREQDVRRPERNVRIEERQGVRIVWVNNTFTDTTDFADSYRHPRLADAVLPLINAWSPQVAHVHHLTCLSTRLVFDIAAKRIPIVYTLHDYWLMCHRGQLLDRHYHLCDGPGQSGCGSCVGPVDGGVSSALKGMGIAKAVSRALPAEATEALASVAQRMSPSTTGPPGRAQELERLLHMRDVCSRIDQFLAPSLYMRDAFLRFGIDANRTAWSPYGFDHDAFCVPHNPSGEAAPLRVGFIGTLMVSKAPHVLLEAHHQLEAGEVEVHLYGSPAAYHGDATYHERLAPLLDRTGVHQHGPRPHSDMPQVLSTLDVLVVPSIWHENSPLVIQEALLAGVPVVASRVGGITELIREGENGFLFEPGNSSELANVLRMLIRDPDLRRRLRQARRDVRTLADDVDASVSLYERLVHANDATTTPVPGMLEEHVGDVPRPAAIVVNYRTPEGTELALRSLLASTSPFDALVCVNNDADATPDRLVSLATRSVHTGANLGFSGGVNVGIREGLAGGATHIMLVNSDVTVPPDTLERLLASLDATPGAGIAGPVIASRTRPDDIASAGIRYSRTTGRMRHLRFGQQVDAASPIPSTIVDAVSGCVMLVKREVFEDVGFFEEDYFYGFEDVDFCVTAGEKGYATVLAGDACVYHYGGQSIGPDSSRRLYFGARNHLLLAHRLSGEDSIVLRLARSATIIFLNLAHAARSPGASLPARLGAVARGVTDYASGRFGPDR